MAREPVQPQLLELTAIDETGAVTRGDGDEPRFVPLVDRLVGSDPVLRRLLGTACVLLLVAGFLVLAAVRTPRRERTEAVVEVAAAPTSGVDALGCPIGRRCLVRSARVLAYQVNARTGISLDVAGWETVDRASGAVYRRVLVESRANPLITVRLTFQCVPNGVLDRTYAGNYQNGQLVAGHYLAEGSGARTTGNGCSAQYWYSIDSLGFPVDPARLMLDDALSDPLLRLTR